MPVTTAKPPDSTAIRPFTIEIPDADLADLGRRLAATRWPTKELVEDRSQGVQLATLRELARYWSTEYDWRKCEARLSAAAVHDRTLCRMGRTGTLRVGAAGGVQIAPVVAMAIPEEREVAIMTSPFSRGFRGRPRSTAIAERLPPGQYETRDFPVLSAGPTPRISLEAWDFTLRGTGGRTARWTWDEFQGLPREPITVDIHCVTKWSKFGTVWEGVSVDTLLAEAAARDVQPAPYVLAVCDGDYTTNLPLADVTGGKAWVALKYGGEALAPEHGGPARLLVPHLYFWKSAKWVRQLQFVERDKPGFWESLGYHNYGDPWREQRYAGDE